MTVVISLVVIVLVAALVGRTCARARPGSRHRAAAVDGGGGSAPLTVDVSDARTSRGAWVPSDGSHHGGHSQAGHSQAGHGHDTGGGSGDSGAAGGDGGGGGGGD